MEISRRILVADTGEDFRRNFMEAIRNEGDIQVVGETGDGIELLRLIETQKPDVIVMEMVLTGMDGVEVLEALPTLKLERRPRVLIVSSFAKGTMAELAASEVRNAAERRLIITHCNAAERAEQVKQMILEKVKFRECIIMDTRGVSSMYANDGGVIVTT